MRYSATTLPEAIAQFTSTNPGYDAPALDRLRAKEYGRLDRLGHTYLDFTGGGLYADSQLNEHHALLADHVLGNPHSHNPTSLAATQFVDEARAAVHEYFRADPAEYDVIFALNASHALKLIGESYPFETGACYLVSYDNHNSVNGIREFARRAGADVAYVPVRTPHLRLEAELIEHGLTHHAPCPNKLFAYPAQSNFSGVQHPLEWIERAQGLGWDVVLDSAAFAPTNRLDLSVIKPDFVPLSFYKMFGYPTGVGALMVRHEALAKLRRPWFAGGTITLASVQGEGWHHLSPGHEGFEDGTVDYLGLPAITIGLNHLASIGIDTIHDRVTALADWLLEQMRTLTHSNGAPMFRIFGPDTMDRRGATIAFYLLDPQGAVFDVHSVERLAGAQRISIRTGCFCNPGDGEVAHEIEQSDMEECFTEPAVPVTYAQCHDIIRDKTGKVPNTVRISLGIASTFADVYRFMTFAEEFCDRDASDIG